MKLKNLFIGLLTSVFLLTGCGSNNNSSSSDVDVVSDFAEGDNSHQTAEKANTTAIRFHYHRYDNDGSYSCYRKWQIWAWDISNGGTGDAYTFDHYDDYGVYVDVTQDAVSGGQSMNIIGFIVAITSDWTKDPDGDRNVTVPGQAPGGIFDVYLLSKSDKIYYDSTSPFKNALDAAILDNSSRSKINVVFSVGQDGFEFDPNKLFVEVAGNRVSNYTVGSISSTYRVALTFTEKLDWTKTIQVGYEFDSDWIDRVSMLVANYYDSDEFVSDYTYDGELGAILDDESAPSSTTFKVWAPTSSSIKLNIYNSSDYINETTPANTYSMTLGSAGVWSYTVNSNLSGKYYTYTVTNSLGTHEVVDPYAKSAGVNGRRGMIVNFTDVNSEISGWDSDTRATFGSSNTDAIIYEAHVRDMTINPNSNVTESYRGKFLGLAEKNTSYTEDGVTVTTGLAHLKELGITHVQLQPFFDYASVDETLDNTDMSDENYNWGYDPQNYNALEGSYSTDPKDGYNRIKEFKTMVMAMHEEGININMDVVYNHTASSEASNFNYLVPNYYYRTTGRGVFYNGSGCGNEFACERPMGRKFVVESCKFWIDEYHLSGFRFDLMGLMDNQTMIDIYNECVALDENIMIYGEPWTGGTSKLESGNSASNLDHQQTVQSSLNQSYFAGNDVLVGAFNDNIRNAVKGDNSPGTGFVQGYPSSVANIAAGVRGLFRSTEKNVSPEQVLNYVSCHDNYTLYDQLIQTNKQNRVFNDMYTQAEAFVLFSEGVPFMQEGEDFLRSKAYEENGTTKYSGNSYNVGDNINNMDYSLKVANIDMFETFKEMIDVRKNTDALRISTRSEISSRICNLYSNSTDGYLRFTLTKADDSGSDIMVVHSLNGYTLDSISATVLYDTHGELTGTSITSLTLGNNQSVVLELN